MGCHRRRNPVRADKAEEVKSKGIYFSFNVSVEVYRVDLPPIPAEEEVLHQGLADRSLAF